MSAPLFFAPSLEADPLILQGPEGRHAVTVVRLQPGEEVTIADGQGSWVRGCVSVVEAKDRLIVDVHSRGKEAVARPKVTIIQAIPKSERSELAVDLATQAGADAIVAWQAQRCVSKWMGPKANKHLMKWQAAAQASAKQSRRCRIPEVTGPLTTSQVAELIAGKPSIVLHEEGAVSLREVNLDVEELFVLIGPEGGIGPEELATLGACTVKLGPQIYRTASAAMVALSSIGILTSRW